MPKRLSFPKKFRLSEKKKISQLFSEGRFFNKGLYKAKALTDNQNSFQLVISVSKRVGNSPARNRIKRLVREALRLRGDLYKKPMLLAIFINAPLTSPPTLTEINSFLDKIFGQVFP